MDNDFFLIQKIKNGQEDAAEVFVRKYYPLILKYCGYHAPDRQNAEDLTQETFVRFFAALPQYRHIGKAANYLYVIAGNLCRDAFGQKAEPLPDILSDGGASSIDKAEERLEISRALQGLPEELREVIILHYFQGLKQKEIAGILRIGLPLVKYRIGRAKELLRAYFSEEEQK